MSRVCCTDCHRPKIACICDFITSTTNEIHVVALVHPNEIKQAKGTLPLLSKSLNNCTVIEGENFTNNQVFNDLLMQYKDEVVLLYPSEQAIKLPAVYKTDNYNTDSQISRCRCLIILDGTWKKSYRMYQLSLNLHHIPHFVLPDNLVGQYKIRKTMKKNALSTLEACCYALEILENEPDKYQTLLNNFVQFNHFQLSFRP